MAPERISELANDIERNISLQVGGLRRERGLTQQELATALGVSKGYVSKIENGRIVPPIALLVTISHALEADISTFLSPGSQSQNDSVGIVRAWERQPAVRGASAFGYDYVSLAHHKRKKHMQPFIFSFPEEKKDTFFEHEGEEFIFILNGTVEWEMEINGEVKKWVLEKGDSIYFESRFKHRGWGLADDTKALIVIFTPG